MVQQVGESIRGIVDRDIFLLKPAGFTPSSEIARTDRNNPAQKIVPVDGSGKIPPGEVLVVSDSSEVVVGGGERVALSSFRTDRGLMHHVLGPHHERLSFLVRRYDSGLWSATAQELKEAFYSLAVYAKDDGALARIISPDHMEEASKRCRYSMLFRDAAETLPKLQHFIGEHPLRFLDPLAAKYHEMKGTLLSLRETPPPIRFNYTAAADQRADSMLIVTSSELGAELLLGWKGEMRCKNGRKLRQEIADGSRPARNFITPIEANRGYAYHIPSLFPFGMTGGIKAYLIEPNVRSYAVDDWNRTPSEALWKNLRDEHAASEVERLFTERVIPWNLMKARVPGDSDRKRHVVKMCDPYLFGRQSWHPFESENFSVSVMPLQYKESAEFSLVSHAMPTVWIMVYGALSVRSPRGYEVDLSEGDACLFPAAACGNYALSVVQEPACLFAVSGTPMPFNALNVEFMRGFAAG